MTARWRVIWFCGWELLNLGHHCRKLTSCDITWPHDQRDIRCGNWEFLDLSHHFVKLDGYRYCRDGEFTFFILSCDSYRLIKLAYDLLSEKPSSFVFIVLVELEKKYFKLTRDNIWQMMKDYWTLQLGAPYCYAT